MFGFFKRSWSRGPSTPEPDGEVDVEVILGFVLLKGDTSLPEVVAHLTGAGVSVDADQAGGTQDDTTVFCHLGGHALSVSLFDAPVPDQEAENLAHPLFFPGAQERLAGYDRHLVVARLGTLSEPEVGVHDVATALAAIKAHATVTAHLLGLKQAVGVYSGRVGTTYAPEVFRGAVLEDAPRSVYVAPTWLRHGERPGTVTSYTFGLSDLGLAELQVTDTRLDAEEVFVYLSDITEYILSGARIRAGETLGRTNEERLPTRWAPWLVDAEVTALQIEM